MPVPPEYERASAQFYEFLLDARETSGLTTTHQSYTMVQGVFQAFRRRLDIREAIRFANILPVALRALFVTDWDTDEPTLPFQDRPTMTSEAQALRAEHNFAPDSAIRDVARALRKYVDETAFDELLSTLPPGAVEFWRT